jgi:hypothetical protein
MSPKTNPAPLAGGVIDEIDREYCIGVDLDERLTRYAALDPLILAMVGADRFPPSPIRRVGGAQ